jgi:hypothetical protein
VSRDARPSIPSGAPGPIVVRNGIAGVSAAPVVLESVSSGAVVVCRPVLGVHEEGRRRGQLHDRDVWRGTLMRQVGDTLVWLALIAVVAAVLYFTPLVASYVSSREKGANVHGRSGVAWHVDEPTGEVTE